MRVLLTNAPVRYYCTTAFYFIDHGSLNLAQLAAMIDTPENQIKILDNLHFYLKSNDIVATIKEFKPDLLAISNNTCSDTELILSIVLEVKEKYPDIILVGGGQAATIKFDYLLTQGFDFVILGEGEITFRELVVALNKKENDLGRINGLAYKFNDEIIKNESRPLVKDLDELPFPARKYQKRLKSVFFPNCYSAEIETTRGCPNLCEFCSITAFWKHTFRKKTNARIMEELKKIKYESEASQVYFIDDNFGIATREHTELLECMIKEKLEFKWLAQIMANTVVDNPEMIKLAARAGLFLALVGFETYNDSILKNIGKNSSKDINLKAAEILRKNKIAVYGDHMFNLPSQTKRDYYLSYKHISSNADVFRVNMFWPVPNTPIFERLNREGKIKNYNIKSYDYTHYQLDSKVNPKEVTLLYYWYVFRHYFNPKTIINTFFNRDRLARKVKIRGYISYSRNIFYLIIRKFGIKHI